MTKGALGHIIAIEKFSKGGINSMKLKTKNALILIVLLVCLGLTAAIAYLGVGEDKVLGYKNIPLGLDLNGGVQITYEAGIDDPTDDQMAAAVGVIRKRLDLNNYTEAEVYREGKKRIYVEIPGIEDQAKAESEMGKTALLEFKGVRQSQVTAPESGKFDNVQAFYDAATEQELTKLVISGADVKSAVNRYSATDATGIAKHHVVLELNKEGADKFSAGTKEFLNNPIAIVLDGQVVSMPNVGSQISDGTAIISGSFTEDSAKELANLINAGALPFKLNRIESNGVGAKLGLDSLNTSIKAGAIGFIFVLLFMLVYYKIPGLAADLALFIYGAIVIMILSAFKVTLTLPGVAGIILSVGMAVDANVVIFSRIKEELMMGKGIRSSIDAGFKKALSAIVDGNVTTLIAAVVLYFFGSGPVKGFAQTLGVGILVSMFTALIITRLFVKGFVELGIDKKVLFGFNQKKYDQMQGSK